MFIMSEPDVALALKQTWVSIVNDNPGTSIDGILGRDHPHPRAYGTFPRILRKYVREGHLLTLPDVIRKFTALPAQTMHLADRGVLKAGMWADIVIFDPDKIRRPRNLRRPQPVLRGMNYVLVNGTPVIADGKMTQALPGKVLRGPGYAHRETMEAEFPRRILDHERTYIGCVAEEGISVSRGLAAQPGCAAPSAARDAYCIVAHASPSGPLTST